MSQRNRLGELAYRYAQMSKWEQPICLGSSIVFASCPIVVHVSRKDCCRSRGDLRRQFSHGAKGSAIGRFVPRRAAVVLQTLNLQIPALGEQPALDGLIAT